MLDLNDEEYLRLAEIILKGVGKEYRRLAWTIQRHPDDKRTLEGCRRLDRYMRTPYFSAICLGDADGIRHGLKELYGPLFPKGRDICEDGTKRTADRHALGRF